MANCCCTFITITPNVPGEAEKFGKMLEEWKEAKYSYDVVNPSSHKNFALHAGLNPADFECRGGVNSITYNSEVISLVNEDDWTPKLVVWFAICNRLFGVDQFCFSYTADECGCGIYVTNDIGLLGSYNWDNHSGDERIREVIGEDTYVVSKKETEGYLRRLLPEISSGASLEDLLDAFEESEWSDLCSIHAWKEADNF